VSIAVRCLDCKRVRFHSPDPGVWTFHDDPLPGEVPVLCRTCGDTRSRLAKRNAAVMDRKLLRDRKRGYGPGTGDPFAGMRGE